MGEVHVKARLTNAIDEALARRRTLAPDRVRSYEADALVDTGATRTVLPPEVVDRLGRGIRGQLVVGDADGHQEALSVTEPLVVEIDGHDTFDEALMLGDQVLIGQTVLGKLDLLVDCDGRRLIPNPRRPASRV
jgi:predicted aspartyl protease